MILADKIAALRKKSGWSQEELAQQLNVTRQSVSKWEGAQSVPDIDKILQMSRLFGVSTDYLLKDELEEPELAATAEKDAQALRRVTLAEASEYLRLRKEAAPKRAIATFLCVISPITLIMLAALSEVSSFGISENAAAGIGLFVLIVLVAVAVMLFMSCAAKESAYDFLESEPFETEYGVSGMVKERRKEIEDSRTRLNMIGTVLCILSVIPLFAALFINPTDIICVAAMCALLLLVGIACIMFVYIGTYAAGMDRLLEEGDYTRSSKARSHITGKVSTIYWLAVTAIFLFYTFGPNGNGQARYSWFIWAIAGVLYGAVIAIVKLVNRAGK